MREGTVFSMSVHTSTGGRGEGVPPSQVRMGGYPISGQDGERVPSSQVRMGGYPHPRSGRGDAISGHDDVPHPADGGVPPSQVRMGYPPPVGRMEGMPLAFTQEDFLVIFAFGGQNVNRWSNLIEHLLYCLSV